MGKNKRNAAFESSVNNTEEKVGNGQHLCQVLLAQAAQPPALLNAGTGSLHCSIAALRSFVTALGSCAKNHYTASKV